MANLVIPRREIWTQQPQGPVEIDWSNPISAGLLRSYDFGNLGRDATRNGAARWSTGSTQPAITTAGRGLKVAASGQLSSNESVSGQISTGITLFLIAEKNAKILSASDFIFGATTELDAGDFNWGFYESVSTGNLSGYVKNASNVSVNVTGGTNWLPDKGPQFWALTYGGGDNFVRLYLNGFEVGSAAQTGLIKQTALNARIAGWNADSTTPGFTVIRADIWNRNIGSDGVARLSKYPWQIFAPQARQLFVPVGGGGSVNANASGALSAVSVAAPSASASGGATASGSFASLTLAAPNATATASGVGAGSFAALSITPATATANATTSATASGAFAAISISAPTATASGTAAGNAIATATPAQITINPATASAIGSAVASGAFAALSITPPTATATSAGDAHAIAAFAALSINPTTGAAYGSAIATGSLPVISLSPATGTASTGTFSGSISDADITRIVQAVLAALNATTIPVNIKQVNSITIKGAGVTGNTWGPQ